jgi:predicted amidophosphoribosyltransferase
MSHLFCPSCGNKLEYANMKPNFCVKCGNQLNVSYAANTAQDQPTIIENVDFGEDETSSESIPHIDKLQVDYEVDNRKTFTVGSLAGKNTPPSNARGNRPKSVDEFINEKEE